MTLICQPREKEKACCLGGPWSYAGSIRGVSGTVFYGCLKSLPDTPCTQNESYVRSTLDMINHTGK
jgi:hypothetical protein